MSAKLTNMTTHQIFFKNLQCGDCVNSIKSNLLNIKGVTAADFFEDENKLCITCTALDMEDIIKTLSSLGYSEKENTGVFSKQNTFDHWYCYCCSGCDS